MNGKAIKLLRKISTRTGLNIKTLKTRWKRLTKKGRGSARKWYDRDMGSSQLLK